MLLSFIKIKITSYIVSQINLIKIQRWDCWEIHLLMTRVPAPYPSLLDWLAEQFRNTIFSGILLFCQISANSVIRPFRFKNSRNSVTTTPSQPRILSRSALKTKQSRYPIVSTILPNYTKIKPKRRPTACREKFPIILKEIWMGIMTFFQVILFNFWWSENLSSWYLSLPIQERMT